MLGKFYVGLFLCLSYFSAYSQNTWGIANSNYAGVSNIDLNPSSMVFSKLGWDINIASFDASLLTNSFYADPQFIFPKLFKNEMKFATSNTDDQAKVKSADLVIRDNIKPATFLSIGANIKGPSVMYTNGVQAVALTTAFRSGVSTFNLPSSLMKIAFENLNYPQLQNQPLTVNKGVSAGAMAWLEIGAGYGRRILERGTTLITGGLSVKLLVGYSGGYAVSRQVDYTTPYRANFTATDLNLDYGHAINTEGQPVSFGNPLGTGGSVDIGFTFIKKKPGRYPYYGCPSLIQRSVVRPNRNYKWKLGLSLIDLGGINFGQRASSFSYSHVAYSWDTITKVNFKTLKDIDQAIFDNYSTHGTLQRKPSFFIWTPTAVSAQFDYNINNIYYVSADIIQRIVITSDARLARMNSIAVIPRYETPEFEVSVPLIVNEYMYPSVGLMVRYLYFFMGTDQLGSTIGMAPLNGVDFYFGIKFSHFGPTGREPRLIY